MTPRVKDIQMDGNWTRFTIVDQWDGMEHTMETNRDGEGLFAMMPTGAWYSDGSPVFEMKQLIGTSQFCARQKTKSGRRRYIQKFFRD